MSCYVSFTCLGLLPSAPSRPPFSPTRAAEPSSNFSACSYSCIRLPSRDTAQRTSFLKVWRSFRFHNQCCFLFAISAVERSFFVVKPVRRDAREIGVASAVAARWICDSRNGVELRHDGPKFGRASLSQSPAMIYDIVRMNRVFKIAHFLQFRFGAPAGWMSRWRPGTFDVAALRAV